MPHQKPRGSTLAQLLVAPHTLTQTWLKIPLLLRQVYTRIVLVSIAIGIAWLLWRWMRRGIHGAHQRALARGAASAGSAILLGQRLLKAAMILAVCLICLSILGVHLTPALAGLGVGGLILAFAAQKTLENVFGGISLLSDQTIRVGDFCNIGGQKGHVEDIGLRSTLVRTLDRTLLSIPNGALANMMIENFAYRDKIWFHPTITLRYETTADQLREVLDRTRALLQEDARVEKESLRVCLARLGSSAIEIDVFAYVLTNDFTAFTAIREELLLKIMDIVEKAGAGLAFPSQTLYLARDRAPRKP
jgi:MscS family membrane protein